jgi:hypothetical protein
VNSICNIPLQNILNPTVNTTRNKKAMTITLTTIYEPLNISDVSVHWNIAIKGMDEP